MASESYIIVGSGVFGASTALHLIRKYPEANITLIDRDSYTATTRVAASWDWNKVIRADYTDIFYTKLGLEAQQVWRTDPLWKPFYHQSGVVWISPSSFAKEVLSNFAELGVDADVDVLSVEEACKAYDGLFRDADYTGVSEVLVNKRGGWAEAKEALQSTIEAAVSLGVKYVVAEVAAIKFDNGNEASRCCGVEAADGKLISADRVVLCTGAYTTKLLLDSAPQRTELHAGNRILAVGVAEGTVPLKPDQRPVLEAMPVGINDNPTNRGLDVGCLPLPKMGGLKIWSQILFRNTVEKPLLASQVTYSAPPAGRDYSQWDVPQILKDDVRFAPTPLFGAGKFDIEVEDSRLCWSEPVTRHIRLVMMLIKLRDAVTPSQDFIVSPHSACEGLYIATCGSFHGFKFLPVIGKYVVEMLSGDLDPTTQKRWAWDRDLPPTEDNKKWAHPELRDFSSEVNVSGSAA